VQRFEPCLIRISNLFRISGFGFRASISHRLTALIHWLEAAGSWTPWCFLGIFLAGSLLMIWRLEAMNAGGLEGTVLGTLVMPYCSGMGNLIFAFVLGAKGGSGADVLTNCLVNNITNLTLLIGLPTIIWGMNVLPAGKPKKQKKKKRNGEQKAQIHRLSLLFTLAAVVFFTGAAWALARNGWLDFNDGLVLIGLFIFWQCFHVFDVLKSNVRQNKSLSWMLPIDLALLGIGAYAIYLSTDWLVDWISKPRDSFINVQHLGWLSGWLMVLPNALLAFFYAWRGNPEVVYTSQVGDGHICIPLCIGVFALHRTIEVPAFFLTGIYILLVAATAHFLAITVFGRLPRAFGWVLIAAYGVFLYAGLIK
jgi:cation:H+ antiporter